MLNDNLYISVTFGVDEEVVESLIFFKLFIGMKN